MEETGLKMEGYDNGSGFCEWFIDNKLDSGIFKPEMLKRIDE
ncbi:MAG: hypothetical protein Q8N38_03565 [Bacteroidales bacterium]|nr:hypothetical protein [Bacteroidales bacterium]